MRDDARAHPHVRRGGSRVSALILDCDGVLADTERLGHLPAFNRTFAEFGLPVRWSEEDYGIALRIGGGKERMAALLTPELVADAGLPADPEGQRPRWPAGTGARPSSTSQMVAGGPAATASRHPAHHGRGARRGLAAGRLLDLRRAVGAGHPRARGRARRCRPTSSCSPAISCPTRSRPRTSTCLALERLGIERRRMPSSSRTRATACSAARAAGLGDGRDRQRLHAATRTSKRPPSWCRRWATRTLIPSRSWPTAVRPDRSGT